MNSVLNTVSAVMILAANISVIIAGMERPKHNNIRAVIAIGVFTAVLLMRRFDHLLGIFRYVALGILYLPVLYVLQKGQTGQKLFVIFSTLTITKLFSLWAGFAGDLLFDHDSKQYAALWFALQSVLLLVYTVLGVRYAKRLFGKMTASVRPRTWFLYAAYPAIAHTALNYCYFEGGRVAPLPMQAGAVYHLMPVFIAAGFLLLCLAIVSTHDRAAAAYELSLAQNVLSSGRDYYAMLADQSDRLRILRHDYQHHLNVIKQMLSGGQQAEAEGYLDQVEQQFEQTQIPLYCESKAVNALLAGFDARSRQQDVAFQAQIDLSHALPIQDYELCIVLGNLLENAMTACLQMGPGKERFVRVHVKPSAYQLAILVENSYEGEIQADGQGPASTKPRGGMGIRSIRMIAERLGGGYFPEWDSGVFRAYVLLNRPF